MVFVIGYNVITVVDILTLFTSSLFLMRIQYSYFKMKHDLKLPNTLLCVVETRKKLLV